ncbi:sulfotransferase family protein [Tepidamorphus gemmatus]|uniref:sulfotransferase family protein n=1 Tax=Tepidamorphus gemmatus TaxID=747076 RepID=UPI00104FF452|nr:sulfotransferase family protein [Tepidamorphus gemmatus]
MLVVGMHRSGTSALTRVLNLVGCDLAERLVKPSPNDNELGFWESRALVDLNEEILASAGSMWDDAAALNPAWFQSPKCVEFKRRAAELLAREYASSSLFALKDPRLCRLARFWGDVLDEARIEAKVILPIRNPLEVAASLHKRNHLPVEVGELVWLRHVLEGEFGTRGRPRFFSSYDRLLSDAPGLIDAAADALGLVWPRRTDRSLAEVQAFLSPRHRHHDATSTGALGTALVPAWVRETYRILDEWTRTGERAADHPILDDVRAEFDRAMAGLARVVDGSRQSAHQVHALAKKASTAEQEIAELRSRLSESEAVRTKLTAEAETSASENAALVSRLSESEAARSRLEREAETRARQAELQGRSYAERIAKLEEQVRQLHEAQGRLRREAQQQVREKTDEIVVLTRLLQQAETTAARGLEAARRDARRAEARSRWAMDVLTLVLDSGLTRFARWGRLLPGPWGRKRLSARLRASDLFDADAYLAENPDVARAGVDPLRHYVRHGIAEGRKGPCRTMPSIRLARRSTERDGTDCRTRDDHPAIRPLRRGMVSRPLSRRWAARHGPRRALSLAWRPSRAGSFAAIRYFGLSRRLSGRRRRRRQSARALRTARALRGAV